MNRVVSFQIMKGKFLSNFLMTLVFPLEHFQLVSFNSFMIVGLFHRAILIAGSSQAPWALVQDPAAVANALAETLNCSSISSVSSSTFHSQSGHSSHNGTGKPLHTPDSLFDCLKNKHFSYFSKFHPPKFSVDFGPSVDGIVIRPDFKVGKSLSN